MADNTLLNAGTGGDNISTDDLSTINGGAVPVAQKVQRVKVGYGSDGDFNDASTTKPLPAHLRDSSGNDMLGSKAIASSIPVAASTEDIARIGITTETAPASDTASSGLNGRLQRIAQRITSLIAQIPAALGQTTMSNSMSVTIASDQSAVQVSQPDTYIIGQGTQTVVGNNIILATAGTGSTDCAGLRSGSVQVVSTGTGGTFIFENSNDGTNFQTMTVYNSSVITGTPITAAITATSSSILYTFPIRARYIRVRIATTITGGSLQAFSRLSQESWSPAVMQVAQATGSNLNATVNKTQINSVALLAGNGVTGTGSQRVTVASDNTPYGVISAVSAVTTNGFTSVASTAYAASIIAKASAGRLYSLTGYNSKTTAQFIQIHNTTTLPADTAVPIYVFTVPAQANFSLDFLPIGRFFATGITICNSSTGPTKTIGSADCWFNVEIA